MKRKNSWINIIKCKMLTLGCFYIAVGFMASKEVTTFDRAGFSVIGTQGGDVLNNNGNTDPPTQKGK